jgi:8-oxo-dGTP pyrophosphatase MutT (NUDIX family)
MKKEHLAGLKRKLPAVPGIHGRKEYSNSVVMILLADIEDEFHFVFQIRSHKISQGGEICFPGGKYNEKTDISPKQTALRETSEEMGVNGKNLEVIGQLDTLIAPMGAVIEIIIGSLHAEVSDLDFNPDEVEEVCTMPVSYFENMEPEKHKVLIKTFSSEIDPETSEKIVYFPVRELGISELYLDSWGNFIQSIYAFKTFKGTIWGITARIILDFLRVLKQSYNLHEQ